MDGLKFKLTEFNMKTYVSGFWSLDLTRPEILHPQRPNFQEWKLEGEYRE
jgi:hypothetical protein